MFHLARKSMSKGSGVSIEERGGHPPPISVRMRRSSGDGSPLELYDRVGVYTRTLQPVESLSPP
jgi:hypothetical protein